MSVVQLSDQDLVNKYHQVQRELVRARFKHSSNQLENTASLRELRRTIARIKTEARRREIERGLPKNGLFASIRPVSEQGEATAQQTGGGFLQGIVDKISGNE